MRGINHRKLRWQQTHQFPSWFLSVGEWWQWEKGQGRWAMRESFAGQSSRKDPPPLRLQGPQALSHRGEPFIEHFCRMHSQRGVPLSKSQIQGMFAPCGLEKTIQGDGGNRRPTWPLVLCLQWGLGWAEAGWARHQHGRAAGGSQTSIWGPGRTRVTLEWQGWSQACLTGQRGRESLCPFVLSEVWPGVFQRSLYLTLFGVESNTEVWLRNQACPLRPRWHWVALLGTWGPTENLHMAEWVLLGPCPAIHTCTSLRSLAVALVTKEMLSPPGVWWPSPPPDSQSQGWCQW